MSNSIEKRLSGFLEGKKLWVWLLVHLSITGVFFGIFRLILYVLGIVPWIGVLALIATGSIWGFARYSSQKSKENKDSGNSEDAVEE